MAETIGWLTDKILISELKIYHMREQLDRKDADSAHKDMCRARLDVLQRQRDDLKEELDEMFQGMIEDKVRPKIYRQYKMYNDPKFRMKK